MVIYFEVMLCVSMLVHAFSVMLAFVEHKVNVQLLTYLSSRVFVYLSESTRREITKHKHFMHSPSDRVGEGVMFLCCSVGTLRPFVRSDIVTTISHERLE